MAGGFISLLPVVLAVIFSVERLPSIYGAVLAVSSIGNFAGPPIAGAIKESFGFGATIIYTALLSIFAFVFALIVRLIQDRNFLTRV